MGLGWLMCAGPEGVVEYCTGATKLKEDIRIYGQCHFDYKPHLTNGPKLIKPPSMWTQILPLCPALAVTL